MNRTFADVIPLYSASVPTPDEVLHIARNYLGDYMCWPSPSENQQRSNRKDCDFDPVRSPWKIAISISISMIVTALSGRDLDLSRSHNVIGHVTIRFPTPHFL